ncbi:MAG: class I SAM-dependent methyltransferase, partial [Candidatus Thorarchaeota archaeon]
MLDSTNDVKAFYNEEAESYDDKRYKSISGAIWHQAQLNALIHLIDRHSEQNPVMLDIGCGTGRFCIPLSKKASRILALDSSQNMLHIVRTKINQEEIFTEIDYLHNDASKTDIPSNSIDVAYSINVFNHLPHLSAVIHEVYRILNKNGILIFNFPNLYSLFFPIGFHVTRK